MMGLDDRSSTASTVSEVFKTVLQSPAPICMFYLSHPFGVVSPPSASKDMFKGTTTSSHGRDDQMASGVVAGSGVGGGFQKRRRKLQGDGDVVNTRSGRAWETNFAGCNHARTTSGPENDCRMRPGHLIPWPRDTWRRAFVLPPLIQFRGKQKDQTTAPELEVILRTIRQAWNPPKYRSNLQSRSYEDTDTPTSECNIFNRNFGITLRQQQQHQVQHHKLQQKRDSMKMGSGNNSTPVVSGLLRRRYSVPEIIMRKHSLAQQKSYEESLAATAPSPYRSPAPTVYHKSYSTNTPNRSFPMSSGSDSNLNLRRVERGEMSMRKSTLLRRVWGREMKRYDEARSGSWSPPMRRSQRRLHPEPVEMHRCEECKKFEGEQSDDSEELAVGASHKRQRLISSNGKETPSQISTPYNTSSNYTQSTSEVVQASTPNNSSLESTPVVPETTSSTSSSQRTNNVHIYMTPIPSDQSETTDQGQDMLHVEIDLDNSEVNGNSIEQKHRHISSDENENEQSQTTPPDTRSKTGKNGSPDSPLDRFISKLLIDNLADLADEIHEQFESNNNFKIQTSTPKSRRTTSVYLSPKNLKVESDSLNNSELPKSAYGTSAFETFESNNISKSAASSNQDRVIYFPSCSLECKDDLSSYTSNCSDLELSSIPGENLVNVSAGSTYPQSEHTSSLVVPRQLNKFSRTESLEAHHSLASALAEDGEDENANDTDDSVSLVDSLDEPHSGINNNDTAAEKTEEPTEDTKTETKDGEDDEEKTSSICREPEAFFIPIASCESQEVKTANMSESMPEKLKEKIMQRQRILDEKRIEEQKRKQKEFEELIDSKSTTHHLSEKSPIRVKKESPVKDKPPIAKKSNQTTKKVRSKGNSVLRTEIGLLESYTIDSKGNMQMRAQKIETTSTSSSLQSGSSKKITRPAIQRKQSVIAQKPPEIVQVVPERKPSSTQTKPKTHAKKDIQKMTIFQAQADIITPDSENGPRRLYQKTEIQDGEKCIEILEIVECFETSPECSPCRQHTFRLTKSGLTRRSKIPIPIYKVGRSAGYQKSSRCPLLREASPNSVKCIARNLQSSGSSKVDRAIAELLIDALNRPEEIGIEVIKSPKDLSREKSSKRQNNQRRNTPRRSANNSKYQQVFEVIPEEKSSFSVDSSAEETGKSSLKTKTGTSTSNPSRPSSESMTTSSTVPAKVLVESPSDPILTSSSNQKSTSNSGRLAVDHAEPNAWIGFFRRHNDSSMDEEDNPSQPYPSSSTESSAQQTITSPSTITALAGTTTPKDVSSTDCINSAESDNILQLIENTFQPKNEVKAKSPPKSRSATDDAPRTTLTIAPVASSTSSKTSETFSSTCKSCKLAEKRNTNTKMNMAQKMRVPEKTKTCQPNPIKKSESALKIPLKKSSESSSQSSISSSSTTAEANSDTKSSNQTQSKQRQTANIPQPDVWRVQSPDICKMAIPKLRTKEKCNEEPSTCELPSEIDTKSFIVVEESCNTSPSRLNYSANIPPITSASTIPTVTTVNEKCTICCYCNPDLHKSIRTATSTPCPYCNRRRTPPKREEETNTESDYFLNHPFYQSMTKSDHTHIRTRSRDSDVVSMKCTKVNEKIKNYNIPEGSSHSHESGSKSKSTKSLHRPKNVVNLPARPEPAPVQKILQDSIKSKDSKGKNSSPDRKAFRLPSPYTNLSSTSYERTSSPSSSSDSTCPTTPSRCPILPPARRPNFSDSRSNSKERERMKQRRERKSDGKVAPNANNNESVSDNANNNAVKVNGQNNGWSVTVAGSYNQDMAPDLEMRLSFPKPGANGSPQQAILPSRTVNHIITDQRNFQQHQQLINGNSIYAESNFQEDDLVNENYSRSSSNMQPALPAPGNPKRTLTRIVSERTHSQRDINFPEVISTSRNPDTSRQMAKKAIKHTECSVAVTSATRTISKFTRGRRTISYHALNTTESHRSKNNRDRHFIRDNSLDLGNLSSSRRLSLESQTPSTTECLALSIMGNAIAPEQKPRVLTMSEKDLTRRHQSCFTRNRAFFT